MPRCICTTCNPSSELLNITTMNIGLIVESALHAATNRLGLGDRSVIAWDVGYMFEYYLSPELVRAINEIGVAEFDERLARYLAEAEKDSQFIVCATSARRGFFRTRSYNLFVLIRRTI